MQSFLHRPYGLISFNDVSEVFRTGMEESSTVDLVPTIGINTAMHARVSAWFDSCQTSQSGHDHYFEVVGSIQYFHSGP